MRMKNKTISNGENQLKFMSCTVKWKDTASLPSTRDEKKEKWDLFK